MEKERRFALIRIAPELIIDILRMNGSVDNKISIYVPKIKGMAAIIHTKIMSIMPQTGMIWKGIMV